MEKANNNYSAYLPDVPGCIATGKTKEETRKSVVEKVRGRYASGEISREEYL